MFGVPDLKTDKDKNMFKRIDRFLLAVFFLALPFGTQAGSTPSAQSAENVLDLQDEIRNWSLFDSSLTRFPKVSSVGSQLDLRLDANNPLSLSIAQASDTGSDASAEGMSPEEQAEMAQIAEAMLNPLSYLWLAFTQLDSIEYEGDALDAIGEDEVVNHTLLLQPVMSIQLTTDWKLVFRPVVPINSFETIDNVNLTTGTTEDPFGVDLDRETGIGDIVLWAAFSKQYKPPNIFGVGVTAMLDTASEDQLGTGKNSIGPMALAFHMTDKWILGVVAQHWESVGGSDTLKVDTSAGTVRVDRPDVSLTDIQPVVRYRLNPLTNIGFAPNWRYDHETDQASIPIGIGFDTLVKWGKLPIKVGLEYYKYVESDDDFGGDQQIRVLFVPVLPAPAWSRDPIFN